MVKTMPQTSKRLAIWAVVVAVILSIPFVTGAPWTVMDYAVAGVILFGAASVYEFATAKMSDRNHRIITAVGVSAVVLMIWVLAVN